MSHERRQEHFSEDEVKGNKDCVIILALVVPLSPYTSNQEDNEETFAPHPLLPQQVLVTSSFFGLIGLLYCFWTY